MVIAVPQSVARGIVFSGLITLPAGTVADSSPRNAHSVSAADAVTAARLSGCGSTRMTDASPLPSSTIASTTIASNGITLSTVVTICTTPICRTPRQLRNVRIQMIAHETIAGPADGLLDRRNELGQVRDRAGHDRGVADPDRHPIAPGRQESRRFAERLARIDVRSGGVRIRPGQSGKNDGEQDAASRGDQPAEDAVHAIRRERCRQQEHARTDHVADDQRQAHPEAEAARGRRFAHVAV